ncbi:MAG: hypothetical protein H6672_05805 [Anaerolineaceae bacterium]|nr:hypothetical protein [Anaerolineaceae bacterium]
MSLDQFETITQIVQALVTSLAIVVGGLWALRKYVFQREGSPRIDFSVDVNFVGVHKDCWVIEILGMLKNHGGVPHKITDLSFNLRYFDTTDSLVEGPDDINQQLLIPNISKRGVWTPARSKEPMIILPGVTLRYSYLHWIPPTAKFLLLHGLLKYHESGLEHRADAVLKVPDMKSS